MALRGAALEASAWSLCLWPESWANVASSCASGVGVASPHPDKQYLCACCCGDGLREGRGGLCASCWLHSADPQEGEELLHTLVHAKGGKTFLRQLLLWRSAPYAPHNRVSPLDPQAASPPPLGRGETWPGRQMPLSGASSLTIIWDAADSSCAAKARAIHSEFPGLCAFVDQSDALAVDALLNCADLAGLPGLRARLCGAGRLSAVLPGVGVYIADCEDHPQVLLFELFYRKSVRLPDLPTLAAMKRDWLKPLQSLASQARCGAPFCARWWAEPVPLRVIAASLVRNKFAIVDGFLDDAHVSALRTFSAELHASPGALRPGLEEQRGNLGGLWGEGNDGDCQNIKNAPRKWSLEGDLRAWIADGSTRAHAVQPLTEAIDALVTSMKKLGPCDGVVASEAARRLRYVDFRESVMAACYPGEARGRYLRHCDTGRGAVLTAIFYLNEAWTEEDGGILRLYDEGFHNTQVKLDVLPQANRLLLFWATEECPHEVLPAMRDRFAMTIWYRDSGRLDDSDGLADMLERCSPVAPLTLEEAVARAGAPEGRAQREALLARTRSVGSRADKQKDKVVVRGMPRSGLFRVIWRLAYVYQ